MTSLPRRVTLVVALFVLFSPLASVASAQAAPDAGVPSTPALTPPALTAAVDPGYPDSARGSGLHPVVTLELTISASGEVTDARVLTAGEAAFDELAVTAMRVARFEPARRNGAPIPSRIRFQLGFQLPAEEVAPIPVDPPDAGVVEPPPILPARLVGTVRARDGGDPMPGARVTLLREGEPAREAITSADGTFTFDALTPGTARLRVESADYDTREHDETLVAGEELGVTYRLDEARDVESFGAVARVDPPPRETTRRSISGPELTNIPGTRGDALRAIELLPGVGRPPGLAGLVLIRGSSPNDSQVFLDGQPVPLLYHFGGLTSFYNSRMIDRIDFYPGNFSVRYGRKVGGVIDVGVRDGRMDQVHGVADINVVDASLLLEVPIG